MRYEYVGLEHFREISTDDVFWYARNSLVRAVVAPLVISLASCLR